MNLSQAQGGKVNIQKRLKEERFKRLVSDSYFLEDFNSVPSWGIFQSASPPKDGINDEFNFGFLSILCLVHWEEVRQCYCRNLASNTLQKLFYFIEDAPLLCILEDFLTRLDLFLAEQETQFDLQSFITESKDASQRKAEDISDQQGSFSQKKLKPETQGKQQGPTSSSVDEDFVKALEMYCLLKQRRLDVEYHWNTVKDCLSTHGRHAPFARTCYSHLIGTLESLVKICERILEALSVDIEGDESHKLPKFVQLCRQLKLSLNEQEVLRYIFIHNVGVIFGKLHSRFSSVGTMALTAATFAGLSSREMLEMFDTERDYLKQELLVPEDEFSTIHTTSFIKMPPSVLKACCGCKLSAEDRYKIDKTAMGEVMSREKEERGKGGKEELSEARDASEVEAAQEERNEEMEEEEPEEKLTLEEEKELGAELEDILRSCAQIQSKTKSTIVTTEAGEGNPEPYTSDLEYLEDNFELLEILGKALQVEASSDEPSYFRDQRKPETVAREKKAKARSLRAKISQRMEATRKLDGWLPRLERLAELRGLDQFEKNVLLFLTGSVVSKNLRNTGGRSSYLNSNLTIGMIIGLLCDKLKEQIESRIYFYKNSKLVKEGLIRVSDAPHHGRGNFLDSPVELDRRLMDYIVGLDTEINELVDGSDLYTPQATLDDVALPTEHKQLLFNTFQSFDRFQKTCKELGLSTKGTNKGICLLFYGPSGTGKTMTANAVANYLNKKILLVTVSLLLDKDITKEMLRFLFREAKIHNAILFFDECECLFESRDIRTSPTLGIILTEIEQYSGVIILATNRHQDLDEAMHRRIQLALPFSVPDYALREEIWKSHVPSSIASPDINWHNLSLNHELTGGLICNAVLSALSLALKNCSSADENPVLTEKILTLGAKLQLRGLLEMVDFERRVIPTFGVQDLVLADNTQKKLQLVLNAGKTHKFISAQWGFGGAGNVAQAGGIVCLICGEPGAGKTAIARAIAYELGQPIKEASCTELLSHVIGSQRTSRGVTAFFRDAQKANAIVVLEGAETMLSGAGSVFTGMVGCEHQTLFHQVDHFNGIIILTSRTKMSLLDLDRLPNLKYVMDLGLPSVEMREKLWKILIPKKAPLATDINHLELAQRFQFHGGDIASTICQAAEQCAMPPGEGSISASAATPAGISHQLLLATAEAEEIRKKDRTFIPSLFS